MTVFNRYYQSGGDTDGSRAALFRCLGPAFADPNLPDVCRATRSSVILARANIAEHLRSGRQRPLLLRAGRVVFSFEGEIEHFKRIRRGCLIAASSDALDAVRGTSEVEMMFAILLTKLQHNVNDALSSTASADLDEQEDRAAALFGLELPLQANVFVNIPAHKGGLQTIFSGGDALAQPREVSMRVRGRLIFRYLALSYTAACNHVYLLIRVCLSASAWRVCLR